MLRAIVLRPHGIARPLVEVSERDAEPEAILYVEVSLEVEPGLEPLIEGRSLEESVLGLSYQVDHLSTRNFSPKAQTLAVEPVREHLHVLAHARPGSVKALAVHGVIVLFARQRIEIRRAGAIEAEHAIGYDDR